MSSPGRLPIEVLRRRYVQMHHSLQAAGTTRVKLEEKIEMLEAEVRALREERDGRG